MGRTRNRMPLTSDELLAVLREAQKRSVRDWVMTLLSYRHGMRASEICGLRLSDLNMRDYRITVRRGKNSLLTEQALEQHTGIPLLNERTALRAYLKERPNDGSDFVFVSQKGGEMSTVQWYRRFREIAEAAGVTDGRAHCHVLKRTRGSLLANSGLPITMVQQMLGHRALTSTLQYLKATPQDAEREAKRIEMALF